MEKGEAKDAAVKKWFAEDFVDWMKKVCRTGSALIEDSDKAYMWIYQSFDANVSDYEMANPKPGWRRHLDQKIANDIIDKVTEVKKSKSAKTEHNDIAVKILLTDQSCHNGSATEPRRMMRGREMLRVIAKHLSTRSTFGQHITVNELLTLVLPDPARPRTRTSRLGSTVGSITTIVLRRKLA